MAKEENKTNSSKGKSNKGIITLVIVVAILVGLALVGRLVYRMIAAKIASGVLSRVTGQNVNIGGNGGNITVKTDKGDLTINSGGSLPNDFPKDFPIYPGAKLTGSFSAKSTNGQEGTGTSVVWETTDDKSKVATYYKSQLASAGYTVVTDYSSSESSTFTFEKGNMSGFVGITKGSDGKTAISVTLGTK